uniref:Uncharacterized protein n=1 Tax=Rhizophora mucronata TaxID=61149 RepID=A0A2P2MZF4_RHIMU
MSVLQSRQPLFNVL